MNTRRVRAGQPFQCSYTGCNVPQGECSGACIRQFVESKPEPEAVEDMPIQFFGDEPWPVSVRIVLIVFLALILLGALIPFYI
jgi:hypothetical protein